MCVWASVTPNEVGHRANKQENQRVKSQRQEGYFSAPTLHLLTGLSRRLLPLPQHTNQLKAAQLISRTDPDAVHYFTSATMS